MDEKIYTPETITENPFPSTVEQSSQSQVSSSSSGDTFSPATVREQVFPLKRRATELLSNALNTRSRKILQEFQLEQSGGLQIGNYQEGVNGDIRLTPNGITARDIAGNTTFALDGTDGSAVFKGTIQSGSLLTGGVVVEDDRGQTIIDGEGIVGANNFIPYNSTKTSDQAITGDAVFQDVTGLAFSSFEFEFTRETPILFFGNIFYTITGDGANLLTRISDGANSYPSDTTWVDLQYVIDATTNTRRFNFMEVFNIPAGITTLKVQCARSTPDETITILGTNSSTRSSFGYLRLGK